jgi:hypothetical protein
LKYFRYETKDNEFHLYPFVCWHIGAEQSDEKFIKEMVKRVKDDPLAKWIYMGDGGECVTKSSKGDVYSQTMDLTSQQNRLVELIKPVREKGLFGIKGNHGNRVYKDTGLDFDETLCAKLGIPYLGLDAFWHLRLGTGSGNPVTASIYTHHGVDSGVSLASKVTKAKVFENVIIADAIMTAHSHVAMELPPRYYASLADTRRQSDNIKWNETREYICGCAYDSRTGYAADKGYPPLLPGHLCITFRIGRDSEDRYVMTQKSDVFRPESL